MEAPKLAAAVMQGLLARTGLAPDAVDEVIVGQVLSGGCGQAPARQAMRAAGIPDATPAMTVNKVCGSGLKAIMLGAGSIRLGDADLVIAGGMESMSLAPYFLKKARTGYRMGHGELLDLMIYDGLQDPYTGRHMGEIGEESAARNGLSRDRAGRICAPLLPVWPRRRSRKASSRTRSCPSSRTARKGTKRSKSDEEPFKVDFAKLTQLRPAFRKDGTITAGNASTISDGAALALLTDEAGLKKHNLTPKARIVATATASLHPDYFPEAPVGAIEKVCARAGLSVSDIDLFEINEAFASVALIAIKQLNLPRDKVNVNGGACAIGHPIGASGGAARRHGDPGTAQAQGALRSRHALYRRRGGGSSHLREGIGNATFPQYLRKSSGFLVRRGAATPPRHPSTALILRKIDVPDKALSKSVSGGNMIKTVGVLGAGQMGNGIAHVFAQYGHDVVLYDIAASQLEKAVATIRQNLERQAKKGVIAEAEIGETMGTDQDHPGTWPILRRSILPWRRSPSRSRSSWRFSAGSTRRSSPGRFSPPTPPPSRSPGSQR